MGWRDGWVCPLQKKILHSQRSSFAHVFFSAFVCFVDVFCTYVVLACVKGRKGF
jgi:hypothetical protein